MAAGWTAHCVGGINGNEFDKHMIHGVKIIPLRQIVDERGKIMHMMKATDPHFIKFGEIYFSCAWPGTIKAWHIHKSMTINNVVMSGRAKLVMYDLRKDSPTKGELQEVFFGEDNYVLVQMPPASPTATRPMATRWSFWPIAPPNRTIRTKSSGSTRLRRKFRMTGD